MIKRMRSEYQYQIISISMTTARTSRRSSSVASSVILETLSVSSSSSLWLLKRYANGKRRMSLVDLLSNKLIFAQASIEHQLPVVTVSATPHGHALMGRDVLVTTSACTQCYDTLWMADHTNIDVLFLLGNRVVIIYDTLKSNAPAVAPCETRSS